MTARPRILLVDDEIAIQRALGPLLPRRWRLNPAHRIAQALIEAAVNARPGVHIVGSEALAE